MVVETVHRSAGGGVVSIWIPKVGGPTGGGLYIVINSVLEDRDLEGVYRHNARGIPN